MKINKIAVIGAGTMGIGIVQTVAHKKIKTYLFDSDLSKLDKVQSTLSNNIDKLISKGILIVEDKIEILKNIELIFSIDQLPKEMDLIIEAIIEKKDVKLALFQTLNEIIASNCIFATNTSSISITELSLFRPEKTIGMHFMNPVPLMQLVEIIRGYSTSDDTFASISDLVIKLDKTPILVNDFPGFVSNRLLMIMINEAIFALMEGVANKEDIDSVMKLGMNHPMGPLRLADFIGLDVCLNIMEVLYDGFKDSKYRPCPLLRKMVAANKLGKKNGEGFYLYK
ncbi:MAG: 3-hydroxyacyl-CoA dehydrogenase NAD-binding domain-containing protein [Ignavibacteriales bacterium]|nr:3-hydroxyacyl-CoA dehydrogenase NAD-binding domain-containing protein [Ignavibacteriales bacterium]